MKIVILDGYTVNPGDLKWDPISILGECDIFDRTPPEKVYERSMNAEIIITNKVIIDREMILKLPGLKYIGVIATGYNVVDLEAARENDITVANIPNYCTKSVAQVVFAHILELSHHLGHHSQTVKSGKWSASKDFCYWDYPQIELYSKIMGIIGCGSIGQAVAGIALQFGMKVLIYDICKRPLDNLEVEFVDLNTLFSKSDVVSLHCPLTPDTKEIINFSTLSKMKKTAFLINAARGPLVNEKELANALKKNIIAGAGLDVLGVEPPLSDNPLFKVKNCFITPHIAWASREARTRLIQYSADNIKAFLSGTTINVVN